MKRKKKKRSGAGATVGRFDQACTWLKAILSDGLGHPVREVEATATEAGVSLAQLPRAKVSLAVKSYKRGRQWLWTLGAVPAPPLSQRQKHLLAMRGIFPDTDEEGAARHSELFARPTTAPLR